MRRSYHEFGQMHLVTTHTPIKIQSVLVTPEIPCTPTPAASCAPG